MSAVTWGVNALPTASCILDGHVQASILTGVIRVRLCVVCRQLWKQELNSVLTATYWERYVRSTILLMRDEGG